MQNIFISYRRDDASDVTGRIADVLKSKFGEDVLFKDVDSIPLGTDFRRVIADAVGRCDVLLAIIGDDWLDAREESGGRRIDEPNDFVHIEIRAALERDIPVIPVLVELTNMPQDKDLPEPLRPLAFRNAISVRADPDFHNDMERLCRALSSVVKQAPKLPRRRPRAAVVLAASLLVMLALVVAAVYFLKKTSVVTPAIDTSWHKKGPISGFSATDYPSGLMVQGQWKTFGGPDDLTRGPDEGLSLVSEGDIASFISVLLPSQPPGTTGLIRRLNPTKYYIACRWDSSMNRSLLKKGDMAKVSNVRTGKSIKARPVDYGPALFTNCVQISVQASKTFWDCKAEMKLRLRYLFQSS
jgi:hypothetical protein